MVIWVYCLARACVLVAMVFSWEGLGHSGIHWLWLHRSGNEEGRTAHGLL